MTYPQIESRGVHPLREIGGGMIMGLARCKPQRHALSSTMTAATLSPVLPSMRRTRARVHRRVCRVDQEV